jgi:hypothetical protein
MDGDQSVDEIRGLLGPLVDQDITRHGFTPYLRDYEVLAEEWDGEDEMIPVRWVFAHCVSASVTTALRPETWRDSWDDSFTDPELATEPEGMGFLWSVGWAAAYPGPNYVADSAEARRWTDHLGRQMHEVKVETNVFTLRVVFHRLTITAS